MYNVGMLMPVDKDTATWTCPLMRMHLAESLLSTIIETPPTLPVINLSGGDCVRSSRVYASALYSPILSCAAH